MLLSWYKHVGAIYKIYIFKEENLHIPFCNLFLNISEFSSIYEIGVYSIVLIFSHYFSIIIIKKKISVKKALVTTRMNADGTRQVPIPLLVSQFRNQIPLNTN